MRYVGQGHEIPVPLPARSAGARRTCRRCARRSTREYARFYDRPVPGSDVEVMSYARHRGDRAGRRTPPRRRRRRAPARPRRQRVRDTATGEVADWAVHDRAALAPGAAVRGPAIIAEDETSTLVGPGWTRARSTRDGYLELAARTA